jgi:DNA-binding phage protein
MALETLPWDIADHLKSPDDMIRYLEIAIEDGDPEDLAFAIKDVARLRGIALEESGPVSELTSLLKVMKALGLELARKAA